jgi:hypothetical protein
MISAEMCFMRRTAGYTLADQKRNKGIVEELHAQQIIEFIEKYRRNWKENVGRMCPVGSPKRF